MDTKTFAASSTLPLPVLKPRLLTLDSRKVHGADGTSVALVQDDGSKRAATSGPGTPKIRDAQFSLRDDSGCAEEELRAPLAGPFPSSGA